VGKICFFVSPLVMSDLILHFRFLVYFCAMPISGIAVVSSMSMPETVSLSSLQFQVSHNTKRDPI